MSNKDYKNYPNVKNMRKRRKEKLVQGFGGRCGICSLIDDPIVYDFHHTDPDGKDFGIANKITSWETAVMEAQKCVMLCSHCHRKHHAGLVTIPIDVPRFRLDLLPPEKVRRTPCLVCGELKPAAKKTCSKRCSNIAQTKVDWSLLPKLFDELKTAVAIAKHYGVSDVAVSKQLKKHGLTPIRRK